MGAVLIVELGGGIFTLAPDVGGILGEAAELTWHFFMTASYAYPSGHVGVGSTVVVGVSNPSHALIWQRRYPTTKRSAREQLTYL
jgi:hypothetical protein